MTDELKPCPFCKSNLQQFGYVRDGKTLRCECGVMFVEYNGPPSNTAEDRLIAKWNTRAIDAENAKLKEALSALIIAMPNVPTAALLIARSNARAALKECE